MNENNKNAILGRNVEILFKNSVRDNPDVVSKIKSFFGILGELDASMQSGIYGEKADVKIGFTCGHNIDANIKAYKRKFAFNQLTRASVDNFCERFEIYDNDREELRNVVINKSKNRDSFLFPKENVEYWKNLFELKKENIIKWAFSKNPSREILVLFDNDEEIFRIYPMKAVIKNISKELKHTKGGFNIGNCISFQRKGGNGSMSKKYSKSDIRHTGNNIQLKLKINKFIPEMEKHLLAKYKL